MQNSFVMLLSDLTFIMLKHEIDVIACLSLGCVENVKVDLEID